VILTLPPVVGGPARFPYTFIARTPGRGQLVAVNRYGCDTPPKAKPDPACFIRSPASGTVDLSQYPPDRVFTLTVQVTAP